MGTARASISRQLMAIRVHDADPEFHYTLLLAKFDHIQSLGGGAAIPGITREHVLGLAIPLPPLATQRAIVAEIEAEQRLVAANAELRSRFERKIQASLARLWGEEDSVAAEVEEWKKPSNLRAISRGLQVALRAGLRGVLWDAFQSNYTSEKYEFSASVYEVLGR